MADDRMKNDDQRNMGAGGREDKEFGQQSPGRTGQSGATGGQQAGQHGQSGGQFGGQKENMGNMEDDNDFATGGTGQTGGQNRGGQNR